MGYKTFIVVLKDDASEEQYKKAVDSITSQGGEVVKHFGDVMKGFSAKIPDDHISVLEKDESIQFIEPDQEVTTQ